MSEQRGGDSERIAPIIPLFRRHAAGDPAAAPDHADGDAPTVSRTDPPTDAQLRDMSPGQARASSSDDAALWRSTWHDAAPGQAVRGDGGRHAGAGADGGTPSARHPARGGAGRAGAAGRPPLLRVLGEPARTDAAPDEGGVSEPSLDDIRSTAEESLLRKLRARSLSVSEARLVLKGHGLDAAAIDDVTDDFCRRGYLDDTVLAEMLVTAGVERKGQGRVALSRALAQRGIPREVIQAALDELPDDDAERALEFARTKARSMSRLDPDTALRRLLGQLSRRGYGGSVATNAAKTALREASFGGGASGVRFVDSD